MMKPARTPAPILILLCAVLPLSSHAQDGAGSPDALPSASVPANRRVIEEIVVSARKKTEDIQDVPISVTTISGDFIQESVIDDMRELIQFTPNVEFSTYNTATIRGIGVQFPDSSLDPSVSIVVDELTMANTIYMAEPIYDLERFEVLRGPQGTLFGKNTLPTPSAISASSATRSGPRRTPDCAC